MKTPWKIFLIVALALGTTLAHYTTDPHDGALHDVYQRFYYLPVILGGLWFGIWGGLGTAMGIAVLYLPHAYHGWTGPQSLFFRMTEIGMYHVVGALTGYLSMRLRQSLRAEHNARLKEIKARQETERAYDNLRQQTDVLFAVEEQLRRSDRLAALGRLSASLAHEIRNPLASIKTSVEILRTRSQQQDDISSSGASSPVSEDNPDFYAVLLEETQRLDRILSEFLEFARTERSESPTELHICVVADAVARTAELLGHQMSQQGVRVEFDPEGLAVPVGISESHLLQVLMNLFLNSMDAMAGAGTIRVGDLRKSSGEISFVVEDTGPGISLEIATQVFEPFFSTKSQGTGLGLSIVERILSSHGGSIELIGTTAPSSRFQIILPRASNEAPPASFAAGTGIA